MGGPDKNNSTKKKRRGKRGERELNQIKKKGIWGQKKEKYIPTDRPNVSKRVFASPYKTQKT